MQKFDYAKCVNTLITVIYKSIGLDKNHVFYSGNSVDIPGYPYMAFNVPDPHRQEQAGPTREWEVYKATININFYSDHGPNFPINACDDLHRILHDPYYTRIFHRNGFAVAYVASNGATNSDVANANDIYSQNIQVTIRLSVHYRSKIENIIRTNLNKNKE